MKIGIDASRAFLDKKTGIEEYSLQIISELRKHFSKGEVTLFVRRGQKEKVEKESLFELPENWQIREIPMLYFWTQLGLAFEILFHPVDVLFVPAHTVPFIHPAKTVVTVHGLEYEHCPESYSWRGYRFHRFFIKKSCLWASGIIAVSKNTKKDLGRLYGIAKDKISVVYNGYDYESLEKNAAEEKKTTDYNWADVKEISMHSESAKEKLEKFVLFVGRLDQRKNIIGIIEAFEILKEKHGYEGNLVLAGKFGHGADQIRRKILASAWRKGIVCLGYVRESQKWQLLKQADVFLFPSFCEGFGIPILEAQISGLPVVTSNYGPMDEVVGDKNVLADPKNPEEIADLAQKLISEREFREKVISRGFENAKRFSWEKSGKEVAGVLVGN